MINFIIKGVVTKKNLSIYLIYLLMITFLIISIIPIGEEEYLIYFYKESYTSNFNSLYKQIISIVCSCLTVIIVFNHDNVYLNNTITYINRSKVIVLKLISYLCLVILNLMIVSIFSLLIVTVTDHKYLINICFLNVNLMVLKDNIMLSLLLILTLRNKDKSIGLLIYFTYVILQLTSVFNNNILIYYVIPFSNNNFKHYSNYHYYYLMYLVTLCLLNIHRYNIEDI